MAIFSAVVGQMLAVHVAQAVGDEREHGQVVGLVLVPLVQVVGVDGSVVRLKVEEIVALGLHMPLATGEEPNDEILVGPCSSHAASPVGRREGVGVLGRQAEHQTPGQQWRWWYVGILWCDGRSLL